MTRNANLKQRVARLERELTDLKAQLKSNGPADWLAEVLGKFEGDPGFAEITRSGRRIRRADRPKVSALTT